MTLFIFCGLLAICGLLLWSVARDEDDDWSDLVLFEDSEEPKK